MFKKECDHMKLKKNGFVQGAFIATICIIISKILGILYVSPFYNIIGEENGALYGYAYTVYNLFLMLASVGFPLGMSKIVSEYTALGYYKTKEKAYKLISKISIIMSFIIFLILFFFAPVLAKLIIGNIQGPDSLRDIVFVIRVISTAIIIVPYLAIARGYLQGHKYIAPTSISQIVEQFIRVIVILTGSYLFMNVFKMPIRYVVGIALFGATLGALAALIYILIKVKKTGKELPPKEEINEEEKDISNREILKKMFMYSIPFIMISIATSIYEFINIAAVNRAMIEILGYTIEEANGVIAVLSTWGNKLNSIVQSISTGIITSLIPALTYSFSKKKHDDVKKKINQTIQVFIYVALPLTVLLSVLAYPVFYAFYGDNTWGPIVFRFSIFLAFFGGLANTTVIMLQSFNKHKMVLFSLLTGVILNAILNIPLMLLVQHLGYYAFYGSILASVISYSITSLIAVLYMRKKIEVGYRDTFMQCIKIVFSIIVMCLVILGLNEVFTFNVPGRMDTILRCGLYGIIGMGIYGLLTYKLKVVDKVFGDKLLDKIFAKFKKGKV